MNLWLRNNGRNGEMATGEGEEKTFEQFYNHENG